VFKSIEDIEKCLKYDEEDPEAFENWARSRGIMNAAYNYFSIRGYEVADIAEFLYNVPIPCLEPQIFDEGKFSISMSLEEPDWIRIRYYSEKDTNIEYTFQYFFDPVKKIDYEGFAKEVTLEEHTFSLYHMRHIGTQGHIDNSTTVEKEFLIGYFSTDFCDIEVWVEGYEDPATVSFDDFKLMSIKEIRNNC
jgi:hypothetical protein